jgi:predicted amino acid-binding ACT domain protein
MTLILEAPDEGIDEEVLRSELQAIGRGLELDAISLAPVSHATQEPPPEPSHIVTVYGVDHRGIVQAVTAALAGADVNITDLNTRLVSDDDGEDLYAMMLEVALPSGLSADGLEALLEDTRDDQGVEVSIRELEHDEL